MPQKLTQYQIWQPLLLASMVGLGMLAGTKIDRFQKRDNDPSVYRDSVIIQPGKVEELLRFIENKYVDEVEGAELAEIAMMEVVNQLDPHSNFISADRIREINEQMQGSYQGIGVEFIVIRDSVHIMRVLEQSPAEKSGIMKGDVILAVDDSTIVGNISRADEVVKLFKSREGNQMDLKIYREGSSEILDFRLKLAKIPSNSVAAAFMVEPEIGYIKLKRFSARSYKEFMEQLEILVEKKGMKDLVIDLRHNPGGYLSEATKILSQIFQDKGKLLVYTEGRNQKREEYRSTGRRFFDIRNVVVLIDEGSASGSEILAGAIQDWDRGVVIGRRSYGKGLVQEQYPLQDGAALRLTVARYYTPSGRLIQKEYEDLEEYYDETDLRLEHGELMYKDSIKLEDTTSYKTLKLKRDVYAGGGIIPDVFIPIEECEIEDSYRNALGEVQVFCFMYWRQHRDDLVTAPSDFIRSDWPGNSAWNEYLQYIEAQGVSVQRLSQACLSKLKHDLKSVMGRVLYDEFVEHEIYVSHDPMVLRSVEILKAQDPLQYALKD